MPKESNRFTGLPKFSGIDDGGHLYGNPEGDDGEVAYTNMGEFGVSISENGELMAMYPEQGLTYVYEQEGPLLLALVDVGRYLSSLPYEQVLKMPNNGDSVIGLVEHLRQERLVMLISIHFGEDNRFSVVVLNEKGEQQVAKDEEDVDFSQGVSGDLGIKENTVAFEIQRYGDDLMIALGERKNNNVDMVGVESSLFVDFEEDVFGLDKKRLQKLSSKIILN